MRRVELGRSAGFTLIEVLIALAIVGLTLAAVAAVFGNGLLGHQAAADAEAALALAEERLALAGVVPPLRSGTSSGVFDERFAWQTTVSPYAQRDETEASNQPNGPALYRIAVSVAWRDGRRSRLLTLSTLQVGAAVK